MKIMLIVVGIFILLAIKGIYDKKSAKKKLYERLKRNWGIVPTEEYSQEKYQSLQYFYEKQYQKNPEGRFFLDSITWNDLDMDELYMTMNNTCSAMGEEVLNALMHELLFDKEKLEERERLITYFSNEEEQRIAFQMILSSIGKHQRISIFEYMSRISDVKRQSNWIHFFSLFGMVLSIALLAASIPASGFLLLFFIVYNVISYYKRKGEIEPYLAVMAYTIRLLHSAEKLNTLQQQELSEYIKPMQETVKKFRFFRRGSSAVAPKSVTGDMMSMLLDYVRILFHTDLIKFNSMLEEFLSKKDELMNVFETIGFLDSMCAAASFRAFFTEHCVPNLSVDAKTSLKVTGLYHPFVTNPVKADLDTVDSILITGSNASGKSTFLKAVAMNAVLAQTIHTALCDSYEASCFQVFTSIALTDNLFENESYYIVEIKSLKRILDAAGKQYPTLCFVDEVLRGTNTVERIAASSRVLLSLSGKNAICFAATHDIELTHLLEHQYKNFHFEEQIEDGKVVFDYQLKEGRATSQNAIWLLAMMGYPENLIQAARNTAKNFMEHGEWKLID